MEKGSFEPLSKTYVGWSKHALHALQSDDAASLRACLEPLSFEGTNSGKTVCLALTSQVSTGLLGRDLCFNYVYDVPRRFKMCEGDTLLDLAHRNNKNNTKDVLRAFGGKARNLLSQEEADLLSIEKARQRRKMEEEGRL